MEPVKEWPDPPNIWPDPKRPGNRLVSTYILGGLDISDGNIVIRSQKEDASGCIISENK